MVSDDAVRLSIIVPCLNESANIEACLHPLQALRALGSEVIVVDGGSDDDTAVRARPLADRVQTAPRGRAAQMNAGAAVARGEWLLFLHSDTRLPDDVERWWRRLATASADWGFFPVRLDGRHPLLRLIERGITLRSRLSGIATGDQALFLRTALFREQRGYAAIPLMEDVELTRRLRRRSRPWIWPGPVTTSSRRWERRGIVRTVLLMWGLRLAYWLGADTRRLHRWYNGPMPS